MSHLKLARTNLRFIHCFVITFQFFIAQQILVHEIGHNLNMKHDFKRSKDDPRFSSKGARCTGIGGYMDYRQGISFFHNQVCQNANGEIFFLGGTINYKPRETNTDSHRKNISPMCNVAYNKAKILDYTTTGPTRTSGLPAPMRTSLTTTTKSVQITTGQSV